jgi:tetratricopeptide (TPR) repeat protein
MDYKCVPAPKNLVIDYSGNHDQAVRSFADLINREATGGWKFHSIKQISVTQEPPKTGCLKGLLILIGVAQKPAATMVQFNMLIFSKEKAAAFVPDTAKYQELPQTARKIAKENELPNNKIEALVQRAKAHYQAKEYDAAIADFNKIIEVAPKNAVVWYNRGCAYYAKGDRARALADWEQATALAPDNVRCREALEKARSAGNGISTA